MGEALTFFSRDCAGLGASLMCLYTNAWGINRKSYSYGAAVLMRYLMWGSLHSWSAAMDVDCLVKQSGVKRGGNYPFMW